MLYFISGINGFIGRAIKKYLKSQKLKVREIDYTKDEYFFDGEYTVIHCAAYGNHAIQEVNKVWASEVVDANINLLIKLLYDSADCKKFYNFSTSSVTLKNQTLYSATKLVGEKIIEGLNDPRFVNIRPYSVFGPGEAAHRFIPTVIRCLNTGEKMQLSTEPCHDWIFIDDFIKAMFEGHTEIGTGIKTSNLAIVRILESISGKTLNFEKVESLRSYDNEDWVCPKGVPHIPLAEALKLTYDSFTG